MKCRKCGYENSEQAHYCANCGKPLKEKTKVSAMKKKRTLLIAICIFACVAGMLFALADRNSDDSKLDNNSEQKICSHIWAGGSCVTPQRCEICDAQSSVVKGHQWTDASCSEPQKCTACGETQGAALNHDWRNANYAAPKTCLRCGAEKGEIKEYSGGDYGQMSGEWVSFTKWDVNPYLLSVKAENCVSFTLTLHLWAVTSGTPYGTWEVYCKEPSGEWVHVEDIDVQQNMTSVEINLDEPLTFTEIAVNRASTKACKHKYEINITDYRVYVE